MQGKKGKSELWDSLKEEQCKDPAVGMCVVKINEECMAALRDHKEKKNRTWGQRVGGQALQSIMNDYKAFTFHLSVWEASVGL